MGLQPRLRHLFFFQAEDGILDIGVAGVQPCALPILRLPFVSMKTPCPRSPIATASGRSSRSSARRDGIGTPCSPLCDSLVEVAKPTAPTAIASDRKSVASGKSVDLGGRCIIKKKILH